MCRSQMQFWRCGHPADNLVKPCRRATRNSIRPFPLCNRLRGPRGYDMVSPNECKICARLHGELDKLWAKVKDLAPYDIGGESNTDDETLEDNESDDDDEDESDTDDQTSEDNESDEDDEANDDQQDDFKTCRKLIFLEKPSEWVDGHLGLISKIRQHLRETYPSLECDAKLSSLEDDVHRSKLQEKFRYLHEIRMNHDVYPDIVWEVLVEFITIRFGNASNLASTESQDGAET